ncbi:MAG: alpha-amylase family protein [Pirellulales bacterium]
MSTTQRLALGIAIGLYSFAAGEAAQSAPQEAKVVAVRIDPDKVAIGNEFLVWEMKLENGRMSTAAVTNRRTGKVATFQGEDFVLEFAGGRSIASSEFHVEKVQEKRLGDGGKQLVLDFTHRDAVARLTTAINPGQWWARRWLTVRAGPGRLEGVTFARWDCEGTRGPSGPGNTALTLGFPSGCGQPLYVGDLFLAIAHPGASNFTTPKGVSCRLAAYDEIAADAPVQSREFVLGAGEAGAARRAFLGYLDATRPVGAHMIFLVNDWYWRDKSHPLEAMQAFARMKQETGMPLDSFTLDDGWDFDWDEATGLWGRLGRKRFPGGWESLQAAGHSADIGVSLWFGPIGGYGTRKQRVAFSQTRGFEINGDRLCLAGPRYQEHVRDCFSRWAAQGMDYIKVDGFWPDCARTDHGHATGPGGAIQQMDALIRVFATWRKANPQLVIGYTSGSNPSPFWLQHCDYVWRGGADDQHEGAGDPFDRYHTFVDGCLQSHRATEMPISGFVTFDIVQGRTRSSSRAAFERGAWWLAARTSLHHDWYVEAGDLTAEEWKVLAHAAKWAKSHETVFRLSRMIGGDPKKGEVYGFAAFEAGAGTLALRNPSDKQRWFEGRLADLLDLSDGERRRAYQLRGVFGATKPLEGRRAATDALRIKLPAFAVAVLEVDGRTSTD